MNQETPKPCFPQASVLNEAPSLLDAALAYASVGLPVLPLVPCGKRPLVPGGVHAATCEPHTIRRWWQRFPQANLGLPMGDPSGCWVLDVDPRHGGQASLKVLVQQEPALLSTRLQRTGGGGIHLCYRMRPEVALSNTVAFAGFPGLDLRVGGGYIVVAPSLHPSGKRYRWHNDLPLLPFPTSLVKRGLAHRQPERLPSSPSSVAPGIVTDREVDLAYWLRCALKHGRPGRRHTYALFLACHLLDDVGLTPQEAEPYLLAYARQVPQDGDDPFPIEEALSCLAWARRRERRVQRSALR